MDKVPVLMTYERRYRNDGGNVRLHYRRARIVAISLEQPSGHSGIFGNAGRVLQDDLM